MVRGDVTRMQKAPMAHPRLGARIRALPQSAGGASAPRVGDMSEERPSPGPVTRLLLDWSDGDERARDAMLPLVYDELRRLAASYLFRERPGHTLRPTELVHEAYLRLIDQRRVDWKNRAQFFGSLRS
jgi:ECF sigma factor